LLGLISSRQAELRSKNIDDVKRREILGAIDHDEAELTALRLRLAAERPALAHARYPKLWTAADLQASVLSSDERLVSYFLGADRSVCWIVSRDGLTTIPLPPRHEIEAQVQEALQELRDPAQDVQAAIPALSKMLAIDRVAALAGGARRIVIIPHGILYDVPFEVLSGADGQALVARYAISYAPSTSSFAFFRSLLRPDPSPTTLVAVGSPIVAPNQTARTRQGDLARMDLLRPLPHSRDEIAAIARLFQPRVHVLEGAEATESAFRASGAGNARILHFATHGLIDEVRPDRSGLILTATPPDDGLLQAREIYSLALRADLVTLSACETALGQNVTGEGIIGLTRAFFFAGARAVVASLWDIEDASAPRLMERFYSNIRRGEPIDVALQHAKLDFIYAGGATARPFYWASFIATGRTDAVVKLPPAGWFDAVSMPSKILIAVIVVVVGFVMYKVGRALSLRERVG
jgi:CHAT domain-containing protein